MGSLASRRTGKRLLPAAVSIALLVASCGGDDDGAADDTASPAPFASSTTSTPVGAGEEPAPSDSELPSGGTIVRASTEPPAIDPAFVTDTEGYTVARLLFEGLVAYDEDLEIVPALAMWEVSGDGTLYTFRLRDDAVFAGGRPVVADDVAFAFRRLADPDTASPRATEWLPIVGWSEALGSDADGLIGNVDLPGVRAVEDHVLEVELTEPSKLLLGELTEPKYAPVPSESFETEDQAAAFADSPVGNGPYRLATPWEHNVAIELERNPDYTGEPGLADHIEFRMFSDDTTAYRETQAGNVDLASVPVELVATARSDFGNRFIQVESPFLFYVGFPLDTSPWDDRDVRRAISLSIDRDALSERLLDSTAVPAVGFVPPQFPGAAASCEYTEIDPERAEALYESSSGVPGDSATAFYPAGAGLEQAAQVIANDLSAAIGLDLTFKSIEWAQFTEMIDTGAIEDPYGTGWAADRADTGDFLAALFETGGPGGTGFSDDRLDALMEELRQTESLEEAEPLLAEAQEIVCDEVPIVPLVFPSALHVHSEDVTNVVIDPAGIERLERLAVIG